MKIDSFLNIEKKYNLNNDTIEGVNYWTYTRFDIWDNIIFKEQLGLGESHNFARMNLVSIFVAFSKMVANCLKRRRVESADVCIINHPRRVFDGKYYECIYTDELSMQLQNSIVLEFPYHFKHFLPVYTENLYYMDDVIIRKGLACILYNTIYKSKYNTLKKQVRAKLCDVFDDIDNEFQIKIKREKIVTLITNNIIYYKSCIKRIETLISKINPKIVVEVVSYDPNCMMINEVCKRRNIPTIELQHGIIENHIAYSYSTNTNVLQFPDKFFLFSDFWKTNLKVPIDSVNVIATGYPYFEGKFNSVGRINEYNDGKINIIFISQGSIGKKLYKLAIELFEGIESTKYRVFYKLHPGELANWEECYPGLKESGINVITHNKYTLYDYFATCQIQIGVYSTALFEGLGFGLSTYIYNIEMSDYMERLCAEGYATYINECSELIKNIYEYNCEKKTNQAFWKREALNNMIFNITELMK